MIQKLVSLRFWGSQERTSSPPSWAGEERHAHTEVFHIISRESDLKAQIHVISRKTFLTAQGSNVKENTYIYIYKGIKGI